MKRSTTTVMFAALLVIALGVGGMKPVRADSPVTLHLGEGSITSTSLDTYGTTWGPENDLWFDLSAGLKVTIYGLDMSQVPYTGSWSWPPADGEDGGSAQLWVYDDHGSFSRHDLTSAGTGGTWDAQGTSVGHDLGFRKYLIQNFYTGWVQWGSSQYNVEPWKGPRLAPGANTGSNMGTPNPESDRFDMEYTYVPGAGSYTVSGRHRMRYAASWDEMSLPKPLWPAYKWTWNKAVNNVGEDAAWLPFFNKTGTVPAFCGAATLRMAFQNRGVPQSGYWTISWDDIVVEYTPAAHDDAGPVVSVTGSPNPAGMNVPIALSASIDDSTTGGSTVVSAQYGIDGVWNAIGAADGYFDEASEEVSISLEGYEEPGVHSICIRGADAYCNVSEECILLAVYDPTAGFVTGGGWIWSPAGAYAADATLVGKATFGFVSKYKKGASTPEGNTEFQFKAGDLSFHSTSYDWLVVAGAKAQFKGSGAINGAGDYAFMLTAIDGALPGGGGADRFRIKIWDKATDALVYDNKVGASDTADPTTTLGGGNIVIHK